MGSMRVLPCRCCMFVCCVHYVAVLNAAFYLTYCVLMLVEDVRGDHMEEAYSTAGLMTTLYVAMSVLFCLSHHVTVSVFYHLLCSVCLY